MLLDSLRELTPSENIGAASSLVAQLKRGDAAATVVAEFLSHAEPKYLSQLLEPSYEEFEVERAFTIHGLRKHEPWFLDVVIAAARTPAWREFSREGFAGLNAGRFVVNEDYFPVDHHRHA